MKRRFPDHKHQQGQKKEAQGEKARREDEGTEHHQVVPIEDAAGSAAAVFQKEDPERAEEEHAREAALYAQKKKEDALRNAEMMGVIFGAEMEAYLLARDFAEEIKEEPWLYCALTDVDPWLVNIL